MYASVNLFLENYVRNVVMVTSDNKDDFIYEVFVNYASEVFSYTYIFLIFMSVITAFAVPVDRGIAVFRFLMFFFGVVMMYR